MNKPAATPKALQKSSHESLLQYGLIFCCYHEIFLKAALIDAVFIDKYVKR